MLYRLFKWLFSLTVRGYFRSIHIEGFENIPISGPVVFVANHNSAFMDPILLAVHVKRPLYFLARGESFKSKIISTFFKYLNMIPIYRPETSPDLVYKNKQVFRKCFEHLAEGKTILIFPEGVSKTERNLQKLKTGTARIVLGAEDKNRFKLNIKIVPIGINYSNPHHFRSQVFINFGKALDVFQYADLFKQDEKKSVLKLTDEIRKKLESLLIIVKDQKSDRLIKQIERLYLNEPRFYDSPRDKATQDFSRAKEIVNVVEYIQKEYPDKATNFEIRISNYLKKLKQLNIADKQIRSRKIRFEFWSNILYFIFGFPIFIYGFLVNILPFKISEIVSKSIFIRDDFVGSMKLGFGMFVFLFFYLIEIITLGSLVHWYWGIAFALSLYPAGLFTIHYLKRYYSLKGNFRYLQLFIEESNLITRLKVIRKELINELEEGRLLYSNAKKQFSF